MQKFEKGFSSVLQQQPIRWRATIQMVTTGQQGQLPHSGFTGQRHCLRPLSTVRRRCQALGRCRAERLPLFYQWARVEPEGRKFDSEAVEHYRKGDCLLQSAWRRTHRDAAALHQPEMAHLQGRLGKPESTVEDF